MIPSFQYLIDTTTSQPSAAPLNSHVRFGFVRTKPTLLHPKNEQLNPSFDRFLPSLHLASFRDLAWKTSLLYNRNRTSNMAERVRSLDAPNVPSLYPRANLRPPARPRRPFSIRKLKWKKVRTLGWRRSSALLRLQISYARRWDRREWTKSFSRYVSGLSRNRIPRPPPHALTHPRTRSLIPLAAITWLSRTTVRRF